MFAENPLRSPLGAIVVAAFILRVALAAATQGLGAPPNGAAQPDQLDYERFAHTMSIGAGYVDAQGAPTALRSPGTSLALLPVYLVTNRSFAAGRIWFCLLSALTCAGVAWMAWPAVGRRASLLGAAWLACYPGHFYYPSHFISEVPYGLWLTLATGCFLRAVTRPVKATPWAITGGVCWGMAILTRPQAMFIVVLAGIAAIGFCHSSRRRAAALIVLTWFACVATMSPWLLRNYWQLGKPVVSMVGGYTLWGANNDVVLSDPELIGTWIKHTDLIDANHRLAGSPIEQEAQAWNYAKDFLTAHVADLPRLEAMKIVRFVTPFEATDNRYVYFAFAAAWIFTMPWVVIGLFTLWRANRLGAAMLLATPLGTLVTVVIFYGSIRFRDSTVPVLVVFAAHGLCAIAARYVPPGFGLAPFKTHGKV